MTTLIYETVHGSRAYGLETPESDTDLKGVIVGPGAWYHGYRKSPEQLEPSGDHVLYEIRKFFRLAAASNPTLVEVLWTRSEDHRTVTAAGERLLEARSAFLSRRVRDSFAGYALSQLRRIETHRRWLLHPPAAEPERVDFGLPKTRSVTKDQQGAAEAMLARGAMTESQLPPNFLRLLDAEKRYRRARKDWDSYQSWRKHRNERRAALEAHFGYDTKHAMHLVRLMRMAGEILDTAAVQVRRPDRDELLAIKAGAWSYDALIEHARALQAGMDERAAASSLPVEPDHDALDALCQSIVEEVLR